MSDVTGVQRVVFDEDSFTINGKCFDLNAPPRQLKRGAVELWTIQSIAGTHPFHIHVNPFLLIERAGRTLNPPVWHDTIVVREDEPAAFLTRYDDFTGKFVIHCHNLRHEDSGMMELVEVVP
jgi:FtsP/CotA-like multicopper oxidase with cupredoxin domain